MSQTLMSIDEAAVFLSLRTSTVRYLVFNKKVPYLKIGKCVRFDKGDLQKWLETKKRVSHG